MALNRRVSLKPYWLEYVNANWEFLSRNVDSSLFEHWDVSHSPYLTPGFEIISAVRVLFGNQDQPVARQYLERACQFVERLDAENRYTYNEEKPPELKPLRLALALPANRGTAHLSVAFARAFLDDALPDVVMVTRAAEDLSAFIKENGAPLSGAFLNHFITCAELLVISGEYGAAEEILKRARRWKDYTDCVALILEVVRCVKSGKPFGLREQFETYFDELRKRPGSPAIRHFSSLLEVVAWGGIYDHLVLGNKPFSWQRAIAEASA
jgi:hypothetical protein